MINLQGKVAIVTGGSRGIGKAIALHMAKLGATVHATARKVEAVQAVADEARAAGAAGKIVPHALEITDTAAQTQLIEQIGDDKAAGGLHILVNNAGITADNLLMRMSDEEIDSVLNTNLRSVIMACRAACPYLGGKRGDKLGRIINLSSTSGVMGNFGQCNYSAAKAGVIGLTKSLARELAKRHVTVNAVAPGFIATDMTDKLSEQIKDEVTKVIPVGRMGNADEIAATVCFLASDLASYITGQVIGVDGGLHM